MNKQKYVNIEPSWTIQLIMVCGIMEELKIIKPRQPTGASLMLTLWNIIRKQAKDMYQEKGSTDIAVQAWKDKQPFYSLSANHKANDWKAFSSPTSPWQERGNNSLIAKNGKERRGERAECHGYNLFPIHSLSLQGPSCPLRNLYLKHNGLDNFQTRSLV